MSSGNIISATDIINLIVGGIDKTTLETKLTASNWISTSARGGSKSGSGTIWTSPNNQSSVRIMTKPDGSCYARGYNRPGGGAPGEKTMNFEEIWQEYDFSVDFLVIANYQKS